jgi:hypothetical protein
MIAWKASATFILAQRDSLRHTGGGGENNILFQAAQTCVLGPTFRLLGNKVVELHIARQRQHDRADAQKTQHFGEEICRVGLIRKGKSPAQRLLRRTDIARIADSIPPRVTGVFAAAMEEVLAV